MYVTNGTNASILAASTLVLTRPLLHSMPHVYQWSGVVASVFILTQKTADAQCSAVLPWLQAKLDELESELLEINGNSERLQRSHSELMELQLVLEKAGGFFDDAQHRASAAHFESGPPSPADSKLLHSDCMMQTAC